MKQLLLVFTIVIAFSVSAQTTHTVNHQNNNKPKLVVGIVIDQMRWDYLYRFYDLYKTNGGFKRLLNEGFSCDNTFVPYLPTVTACGHTCVYTGSVPAIHGITGNTWWDNNLNKSVYCAEDKTVSTVGSNTVDVGQMSPRNVWVTTITDELRLATNFRSKVIGLSMKDRGSIIPAGHSANAAYWYDGKSGNFITSTYYMNTLPEWVQQFNNRKLTDSLYDKNWNLLFDNNVYLKYCDTNYETYTGKPFGKKASFPYDLKQYKNKDFSKILSTPYGNVLLEEMAKNTIANEALGKHDVTDFLTVSFSSTDYVGHAFGPNSWELLETYVRLDETLANLFTYLDNTVGKNEYTVFLTADHAGAHVPEFLNKHGIDGGRWEDKEIKKELINFTKNTFGTSLINAVYEHDIYINHALVDSLKLNLQNVKQTISAYLLKDNKVLQVVDKPNAAQATIPQKIKDMIVNGYNATRSGDLQMITKTGIMDAGKTGMSHGAWNAYDSHIPLLWYGAGIKHGSTHREVYMTDIAATLAAFLNIQMPSGCIGKVITEIVP
ncbi:MAG: alkaline phosphatase family protein [Bacteroidetes bacterium]|nr:alkaline phosphatase family protein [Bacteroidota bacterium]MBS1671608.1 alkaline phosphatase family protein [Bacteroidota bacterium]